MRRTSHIVPDLPSLTIDFLIPPRKNSVRPSHTAPLSEDEGQEETYIRARRRQQTPSATTIGGGRGMSSCRRRNWPAFRSDRRVLALVPGNDRGSVGSKAVGKPDKTPLFDLVRKHFCAPGTILRPFQSRLQTALRRINRPSIAKLQPTRRLAVRGNGAFPRTCPGQARTVASIGPVLARHPFLSACSRQPAHRHLTHKGEYYRGALRSRSGDFSFSRSEFRTAET
jgi:hypothetical protein